MVNGKILLRKKGQTVYKPGFVFAISCNGRSFIWDARCRTPRATNPSRARGKRRASMSLSPDMRYAAPIRFCFGWGFPCRSRCRERGALLPHLFTLAAPQPFRAKAGGFFSVALSFGLPQPDVIRHHFSLKPGLSSPPYETNEAINIRPCLFHEVGRSSNRLTIVTITCKVSPKNNNF